ncbi:MAG: clan AA aspartic protease [Planctomycetales bacterium]|nr:clan AA aspartic protease [Planctomycetales bacterium]
MTLLGRQVQHVRIDAVIDTGYDGWLLLPPSLIAELGYEWSTECRVVLADGTRTSFDVYRGTVLWDRRRRTISIDEADSSPLIGMKLLEGFELTIQARNGGPVTIRRLPRNKKS